jgi:hypothetical protein
MPHRSAQRDVRAADRQAKWFEVLDLHTFGDSLELVAKSARQWMPAV